MRTGRPGCCHAATVGRCDAAAQAAFAAGDAVAAAVALAAGGVGGARWWCCRRNAAGIDGCVEEEPRLVPTAEGDESVLLFNGDIWKENNFNCFLRLLISTSTRHLNNVNQVFRFTVRRTGDAVQVGLQISSRYKYVPLLSPIHNVLSPTWFLR